MTRPTIARGSTGQAVIDAQNALNTRFPPWSTIDVDGKFGNHTFAAVVDYQDARSAGTQMAYTWPLEVDGVIGPMTWGRLIPDTVKKNDTGATVRLLQAMLKAFNLPQYDPGMIDGSFGTNTETALKNYQMDFGVTGDPAGTAGPNTWTSLNS
jgi:peptidoglycan hydrolase-like protein with peptidoglycan-binding domain